MDEPLRQKLSRRCDCSVRVAEDECRIAAGEMELANQLPWSTSLSERFRERLTATGSVSDSLRPMSDEIASAHGIEVVTDWMT